MSHARRWLMPAAFMLIVGCDKTDIDRLTRLSKRLAAKAQASPMTAALDTNCAFPLLRLGPDVGIEGRVRSRLAADKLLAEARVEVQASGDQVTLTGKVADLQRRRRAVELAETTVGVGKVTDKLETGTP